jgi:uncharacterized protein YqjF (DUF2071 family)
VGGAVPKTLWSLRVRNLHISRLRRYKPNESERLSVLGKERKRNTFQSLDVAVQKLAECGHRFLAIPYRIARLAMILESLERRCIRNGHCGDDGAVVVVVVLVAVVDR